MTINESKFIKFLHVGTYQPTLFDAVSYNIAYNNR